MKNLNFGLKREGQGFTKARRSPVMLRALAVSLLMLMLGVGETWGSYTPGSGYTKVTSISQLAQHTDQVILYEESTGKAVNGCDGTDATLSATQAAWTIFTVPLSHEHLHWYLLP